MSQSQNVQQSKNFFSWHICDLFICYELKNLGEHPLSVVIPYIFARACTKVVLTWSSCFSIQELQTLERSNAALVKEISELEKELQRYTTTLKEHEPHCTLSCWSAPSIPDMSTSDFPQPINSNPGEEPIFPTHDPTALDFSLAELLDRTEWMPWDSDIRLPPFWKEMVDVKAENKQKRSCAIVTSPYHPIWI